MDPIVLGRSDIGFGKVVIDDAGVRRDRLIRSHSIRWYDIIERSPPPLRSQYAAAS